MNNILPANHIEIQVFIDLLYKFRLKKNIKDSQISLEIKVNSQNIYNSLFFIIIDQNLMCLFIINLV